MVNCYHSLDDTDTETVAITSVFSHEKCWELFEDHEILRYSLFDRMVSKHLVIDFIGKYSNCKERHSSIQLRKVKPTIIKQLGVICDVG